MRNYASQLIMTLPGDRIKYYQTSDVSKMRSEIYGVTNQIAGTLGLYPLVAENKLLKSM